MDTIKYELIRTAGSFRLYRSALGWTVVVCDERRYRVYSAMPGDHPKQQGTRWMADLCDAGIAYVSRNYSKSYAMRMFRALTNQ